MTDILEVAVEAICRRRYREVWDVLTIRQREDVRRLVQDELAAALPYLATVKPDRDTVWTCGHCGQGPEAHASGGPADSCVYEPVLAADPRRTEAEVKAEALDEVAACAITMRDPLGYNVRIVFLEDVQDRAARLRGERP